MRTHGEIERDYQMLAVFRRGADALDAIASALNAINDTLIAINDKLTAPVYLTPREALVVGKRDFPATSAGPTGEPKNE